MVKHRKSGNPMPLYIVNVLPRAKFEKIYQIKIKNKVKIKAFESHRVKAIIIQENTKT